MRSTEIAIVGGGLAGSLVAAMLGRAGIDAILIDPHPIYPPDFRCEKLDGPQVEILRKTGLADAILPAGTFDGESWVAHLGHIVDKRPGDQYGILYDTLVNTVRAQIPSNVACLYAKVAQIDTSDDRQIVTLSDNEQIAARLVVLAAGLNVRLVNGLGLTREMLSPCHSISVGFNARPARGERFSFPALTHYSESPAARVPFLTLFPIGQTMRANLFVYRDMNDPWLRELRNNPQETLFAAMPGLPRTMGPFEVADKIQIRPVDLYETRGHLQPGVVLIGDAFSTSCPAAGTGARKTLNDAERLVNCYIPQWQATPGIGVDKVGAFYNDPIKLACDNFSRSKAFKLRTATIEQSRGRTAQRLIKFGAHWARGSVRSAARSMRARDAVEHLNANGRLLANGHAKNPSATPKAEGSGQDTSMSAPTAG
jgi:2-polyprenyl-6-methoxyphenol hydroxylase-like FAD-dependent oxidoreductase